MKLIFGLILLLLTPVWLTMAFEGLVRGPAEFAPVTLESLAAPDGGPDVFVSAEGYLLRLKAPNAVRDGRDYVFPFVDRATAEQAVATGEYTFSGPGLPLVARVEAKSLPLEAFARPPAGTSEPIAIPYTLQGKRRVMTLNSKSRVPALAGIQRQSTIVLLDGSPAIISRGGGAFFGGVGALLLFFGLRLLRTWRRERREEREQLERWKELRRVRSEAGGSGATAAVSGSGKARLPSGRSRGIPWGRIAGVVIVIGIAGARFGKSVAPAADNVARGVARSADEVASGARSAGKPARELPSASDLALEAAGQLPNVKTAVDAVRSSPPGTPKTSGPGLGAPDRFRLTVTVNSSKETYQRVASGGSTSLDPDVLDFELSKLLTVGVLDGKLSGRPRIHMTQKDTDLPDRSRGEFMRISLRPVGAGVRLTQSMAMALEDGYVEVMEAAGDMAFVGGGSWQDLVSGQGSWLLEFTDAGSAEYARGAASIFARSAEVSLAKEGLRGWKLEASYREPPVQELAFEEGKAILRQRGSSILEMSGRDR